MKYVIAIIIGIAVFATIVMGVILATRKKGPSPSPPGPPPGPPGPPGPPPPGPCPTVEGCKSYGTDCKCTECIQGYDINRNCAVCVKGYDPNNKCEFCLPNFVSPYCEDCIGKFKGKDCLECEKGWVGMNCDTPIKCDPSGNCTDAQTRADISNWLIQKSNEAQSTPIDGTITAMCCTRTDDDTDLCDTTDYHCSKSDPMVFLPFRNGTWDNTADFYTPSGFSWKCISEDGTAQACLTDDNYNPNACLSSTTGEATTQAVNTHQWFGCRDDLMSPQFLPSGVKGNKDNIKLGHKYWGVQIKK